MKKIELPATLTEVQTIRTNDGKGEVVTNPLEVLAQSLGLKTSIARDYLRLSLENAILFDRKQQDYGPRNIAQFGVPGVLVRMNDKMERLKTLIGNKPRKAQNESVEDSLRDLHVYSNIAILLRKDLWPSQ